MRRSAAALSVVCLLAFALTGCMGGADDDDSVASLAQGGSGDGKDRLGVIEGRVVNEGLEAIEGARVVLHATEEPLARATTSSTGSYRFEEVPAGQYGVRVLTGCCQQQTKRAEIGAGDSLRLNFVLDPLTVDELRQPYVEAYEWTGLMACGVGFPLGGSFNMCFANPNHDNAHWFEVRPGVQSVSVAMEWKSSTTSSEELRLVTQSGCEQGRQACDGFRVAKEGESVLAYTINNEDIEDPGERWEAMGNSTWTLMFMVWTVGVPLGVSFEQEFTVHYHVHYWQEAPEGYSALPG